MKFWDSSAVVPLCFAQPQTSEVRSLIAGDPVLVAWWGTRTECISAVTRAQRDGDLDSRFAQQARVILERLASQWSEVQPSEPVRLRAERLLAVHPLRAADACQLAAALLWSRGDTAGRDFVSLDRRLRGAAQREGFVVVP